MPYSRPKLVTLRDVDRAGIADLYVLRWDAEAGKHRYFDVLSVADAAGTAAASLVAHIAEANPHTQYPLASSVTASLAGKAALVHAHALTDVTGLATALAGKADVGHTHTPDEITGLNDTLAAKADLISGVVPSSQLPALVRTDVYTVENETAMLALDAQEGDVAIRTDLSKTYIHNGGTAGTAADWSECLSPTDAVTSVNGLIGNVTLGYADVGAAAASHTHGMDDVTGLQSSLDSKADVSDLSDHLADTDNPHSVTAAQVGLGNVTNNRQLNWGSCLSDIPDKAAARSNLGLGSLATRNSITNSDVPALSGGTSAASLAISGNAASPVTVTRSGASGGVVINYVNSSGVGTWIGCPGGSIPAIIGIKSDSSDNFFQVTGGANSALTLKNNAKLGFCASNALDAGGTDTYLTRAAAGHIGLSGALQLGAAIADASALSNSLFIGSAHSNKLCFKDGSGVVHELF